MNVCCGGILGMGETELDRAQLLHTLATLPQHPESVPINQLVQVEGTPLNGLPPLDPLDLVRTIATARLLMPRSYLRLSAGRTDMSEAVQALCFLAGANSIFYGERLLTTPNPGRTRDDELFARLGLQPETGAAGARRLRRGAPRWSHSRDHSRRACRHSLRPDELRTRREVQSRAPGGVRASIGGSELLAFCSNDYLGLADHPRVVEAFVAAAREWGVGSGASHLVSGHCREHHAAGAGTCGFHAQAARAAFLDRLHGEPRGRDHAGGAGATG